MRFRAKITHLWVFGARGARLGKIARFVLRIDIGAKYVDLALVYQAKSHHFHVPNPLGLLVVSVRACVPCTHLR